MHHRRFQQPELTRSPHLPYSEYSHHCRQALARSLEVKLARQVKLDNERAANINFLLLAKLGLPTDVTMCHNDAIAPLSLAPNLQQGQRRYSMDRLICQLF